MEAFIDTFWNIWFYLQASLPLQIVTASSICLFLGIGIQIYTQVMKGGSKDVFALETHGIAVPKEKRMKAILMTFICSIALLIGALQSLNGLPPFEGPMEFIYLISIFVLIGGVGILVQINHPKFADYPFATLVATAIAFMFVSTKVNFQEGSTTQMIAQLFVLSACGYLAKKVFFPQWISKARIVFVIAFVAWLLIFSVA